MIEIVRVNPSGMSRAVDTIAVEEPLELRLHGFSFAVLMRTPGDDEHLAAGFLFSERVVNGTEEIAAIEPCRDAEHPQARNILNVTLQGDAARRLDALLEARRCVVTTSSCGVCGRLSIESLQVHAPYVDSPVTMTREVVGALPRALRERQALFSDTGGLHAAGLFTLEGACMSAFEDVGRHNAVDKLVGRELREGRLPAGERALMVSGRASFELVQKAFLAGIPIMAAVSAPSTLAIQLADVAGITLIGFVRADGFNIYTHPVRVAR